MTNFILIPSNPAPSGSNVAMRQTADEGSLRTAFFPVENARGCVVLMSGRSEFIEKYFEVINDLHKRRLSVATMDWRGQGLSSRLLPVSEKGHINSFDTYKNDLRNFIENDVQPQFDGPYILMTHSMGGMPALMLMADGFDLFSRAVLCAPMTDFNVTPLARLVGKTTAKIAHRLGFSRTIVAGVKEYSLEFEGNVLTSDKMRHTRFHDLQAAAPNACIYSPTYGWLNAAIDAIETIHADGALADIKTPTLIISAEHDELVSTADHAVLAAANDQIENVVVKGALHEILMERDALRTQYWDAFDAFVEPVFASTT